MKWRTIALMACTYAVIRRAGQPRHVHANLFNDRYLAGLPGWRTGTMGIAPMVAIILHDRRSKPDKIGIFRRILTVTNLMLLAGNKPGEPRRMKRGLG